MTQNKFRLETWYAEPVKDSGLWTVKVKRDIARKGFVKIASQVYDENAHLIAAAPDLYEAVDYMLEVMRMGDVDIFEENEYKKHYRSAKIKMQKAIAKARGKL